MGRSYGELVRAWKALRLLGVRVREIACVGVPRTLLVAELGSADAPAVHVIAGVHGDEPAPPWALLSLVRDGLLDPRFAYRLWPCLNPSGYAAGTRPNAEGEDINRGFSRGGTTPESRALLTANRDRRFVLALDLHEDFEARGAYLYESAGSASNLSYARPIVDALDDAGLPVEDVAHDFDLGAPEGIAPEAVFRLQRGIVLVDWEAEIRLFPGAASSPALVYRGTPNAVTFESPRARPWDERLAAHRVAVTAALALTASRA